MKRIVIATLLPLMALAGCHKHGTANPPTKTGDTKQASRPADGHKPIDWAKVNHEADVIKAQQDATIKGRTDREAAAIAEAKRTGGPVAVHFAPPGSPQATKDGPATPRVVPPLPPGAPEIVPATPRTSTPH